jgi:hypothetical protein
VVNHSGNRRFRQEIEAQIEEYSNEGKTAKTTRIYGFLHHARQNSPQTGGFVKQDPTTKRWYAVEGTAARITIAQAFRDALSNLHTSPSAYKSSKQFKRHRRSKLKYCPAPKRDSSHKSESKNRGTADITLYNAFTAYAGHKTLPKHEGFFGTGTSPKDQLSDILGCNFLSLTAEPAPSSSIADSFNTTCGEDQCTKDLDLDKLVDILGVVESTMSDNPYEPTPISTPQSVPSAASVPMPMPATSRQESCVPFVAAWLPPAPKMEEEGFGLFWDV